ncbi:MAG TPA: deoxyribose-phosphate aldolase [Pseudogracilibacillus sp.]|nr:deoxyribose-phosphate aldolase [Pseudogracilibacillus sp.]
MKENNLNTYIDHTLLKAESSREEIVTLCAEAKRYEFAAVCVNPTWVKLASEELQDSQVQVATVVGFPLGATTTVTKVAETRDALLNGATEIDMVINIGALKSADEALVYEDIKEVVEAASDRADVKVIIETSLLTDDEKRLACQLAKEAGAHFVKTSTGFSSGGATVADIELMRAVVGDSMGIKASGGVRDRASAEAMIEAGATRIGASAGIAIVSEK